MREPWLTKREIAAELKVSVRTIERLRLPAWRVGGQNRYKPAEVERFLRDDASVIASNVIRLPQRKATP